MIKCRHDVSEDCPACMSDEIKRLREALRLARGDMLVLVEEIDRELRHPVGEAK